MKEGRQDVDRVRAGPVFTVPSEAHDASVTRTDLGSDRRSDAAAATGDATSGRPADDVGRAPERRLAVTA